MANWRFYRCLEATMLDFLIATASTAGLKDINGNSITFRCGRKKDKSWSLPLITLYMDTEVASRFEIGSFLRDDSQTIIIDIYALTEADRLDLAKWVVDTINNGCVYYNYADNPEDSEAPTKTANGRIKVADFLENTRTNLGQNVDVYDQHRHRISIRVEKPGS